MSTAPARTGADQGPILMGIAWSFTIGASIFFGLRLFCRLYYVQKLWWDDFWMGTSLFFSYAITISWSVYTANGAADYHPLTPAQMATNNLINWISQCFIITALVTGKIAIAALIKRLQAPCRWRTVVLWVVPGFITAWCAAQIVMVWVQCSPSRKLWEPAIEGTCWNPAVVTYNAMAIGVYLGLCDVLLAVLPIQMIWGLKLNTKRKIVLCILLGMGIVVSAVTIVRITMLPALLDRGVDFTRTTVLLFIWVTIEVNIVIMAGCLPTIMPVLECFRGRRPGDSTTKSKSNSKSATIFSQSATLSKPFQRNGTVSGQSINETLIDDNERDNSLYSTHCQGGEGSEPLARDQSYEMSNGITVTKDVHVPMSVP